MASALQRPWKLLPLPSLSGIPALLVFIAVEPSSYVVRISDMANVWLESMDRKAICMRGWDENTSIDPSDTPENMSKFLSCLSEVLGGSQESDRGTSLTLAPGKAADCGDDGLTLKITCPLAGFPPLKWPLHLRKQPPSSIAIDLVLPLVQAHYARQTEIMHLMETIGQKDAVINKMIDKLDSMGTGLENVFTALSGRKKVTRSTAEERVTGLATFDASKWKESVEDGSNGTTQVGHLLGRVFAPDGLDQRGNLEVEESPELDRWWHNFKPATHRKHAETVKLPKEVASSVPGPDGSKNEDDDFQTQATPPHLQSAGKGAVDSDVVVPADDASTEGEDDSVIPDSNPVPETSTRSQDSEPDAKSSRLGTIGGKKTAPSRPRPSPKSAAPTAQQPDDDETASEESEDDVAQTMHHTTPGSEKSAAHGPSKKGGLGRIGGGTAKSQSETRHSAPGTTTNAATSKTTPKKLGAIGGKSASGAKDTDSNPTRGGGEDRGRAASRIANEKASRETSEERADRKREELKRDLEKKAAAGPARKKRRF